ncbi:MAG: hypothetical protein KGL39_54585 [Patescibacteria group bacterium]|nr:hypothetical protein [Patescibacteria group bacterium]
MRAPRTKGEQIRLLIAAMPDASAREIAEHVGSTPGRVRTIRSQLRKPRAQRNAAQRLAWAVERVRQLEARVARLEALVRG